MSEEKEKIIEEIKDLQRMKVQLQMAGAIPFETTPLYVGWVKPDFGSNVRYHDIHKPIFSDYKGRMGAGANLSFNKFFKSITFGTLTGTYVKYIEVKTEDLGVFCVYKCDETKEFFRFSDLHQHYQMWNWLVDFLDQHSEEFKRGDYAIGLHERKTSMGSENQSELSKEQTQAQKV